MRVESKAPSRKGDVFKRVKRLTLTSEHEDDERFLSDLHRILVAGSTTRRAFAKEAAQLRAVLDTPDLNPKEHVVSMLPRAADGCLLKCSCGWKLRIENDLHGFVTNREARKHIAEMEA